MQLQYGDRNPSAANSNPGTLSRGFENSFQENRLSHNTKCTQHDMAEKWKTVGKGFEDFAFIQSCGAKDKRKRKLADVPPVKEFKTERHLLDEERGKLYLTGFFFFFSCGNNG